jgi:hypothetical protein
MRAIAFALLLFVATACPAFASRILIQARSSTWGCQYSATLRLFPKFSVSSKTDVDRILDSGNCLPIAKHQRLIVVSNFSSAYLGVRDMHKYGMWAVFVRKSDFSLLHRQHNGKSVRN